jgi:hypothetical protein
MTEAPHESSTANTTPASGGNAGTTPPEAAQTGTTPPPESGNQPDIDKIVKTRLDRERKKWEAERVEAEERARMSEAERLKADLANRDALIKEAEARALAAERRAALTGKVVDPQAALKLMGDDHVDEDGNVSVEKLLEAYPFLRPASAAPATAPEPPRRTPAANAAQSSAADPLSPKDFLGKSPEWVRANRHRLKE